MHSRTAKAEQWTPGAAEDQEAVFEEFRQVGTADKKVEGTGLGLALSRKFVERIANTGPFPAAVAPSGPRPPDVICQTRTRNARGARWHSHSRSPRRGRDLDELTPIIGRHPEIPVDKMTSPGYTGRCGSM